MSFAEEEGWGDSGVLIVFLPTILRLEGGFRLEFSLGAAYGIVATFCMHLDLDLWGGKPGFFYWLADQARDQFEPVSDSSRSHPE